MLTALLFDLDGTLVNTDPIHFQTWKDILKDYGLTIDRPFYEANFSGRTNAAIVQDLLPHLTELEGRQLSNQKEAEFRSRTAGELQPLAGLSEILVWANDRQLNQAVVTNAPQENAEFMLQVLGLTQQFETVVLAETLERAKPDPLAYQVGLERLGATANCAIAFEDSPSGIRSAVGAGILTVGIASTHLREDLYAVGATLVVPDFGDRALNEFLNDTFSRLGAGS
ncbi:HAD family phosphatase [Phormidium sp. CLA17]|uniref:HAD family hydrolase n=1 Tax=Leptolyngbya sp. Cla-17 TaxID=2803751 RepID=UPI001492118B|nr:HAD family phosphatase [Leptolyngbya sp. Cla-17]MBM0740080.1 HAD family phosphatase [Leptolyngbya sp. Cla-17]